LVGDRRNGYGPCTYPTMYLREVVAETKPEAVRGEKAVAKQALLYM